jgi:hypothetical protein
MPATDEDIVRDLLHRYTDHVRPPASVVTEVVARQRRRDRGRRVASLAATGAALGTAAGVIAVVPGHSAPAPAASGSTRPGSTQPAIRLTADQRELYRLSSVAAKQARGQGRYAVMSTEGSDVKDTSVIDSHTGNMWSYQAGTDGSPSGKGYTPRYSPTAAQFAAMPTGLGRPPRRPHLPVGNTEQPGRESGRQDRGPGRGRHESSATGAVLESTVTYPPGSDIVTPQDPTGNGTVVDTTVYTSVTWASAVPADPYGG